MPDRITIFRGPLCALARDEEDLAAQVRVTVLHEVGHYFGLVGRPPARAGLGMNARRSSGRSARTGPGIAAAITGPMFELACNLEDISMTILSGQFAMVARGRAARRRRRGRPRAGAAPSPRRRSTSGSRCGRSGPEETAVPGPSTACSRSTAPTTPGSSHRFVTLLADAQVNITDLATRVIGQPDEPVYAMVLEVMLPAGLRARRRCATG